MTHETDRNQELLDRAVAAVRDEPVDETAAARAADRVRRRLREESAGGPIRSCDDFRRLIPDHLAGRLPAARRRLLEDHTRECIPCRRAVADAREGGAATAPRRTRPHRRGPALHRWGWAAAAALVAATAALLVAGGLFDGAATARVEVADGTLLAADGERLVRLAPGAVVDERRAVRTGPGSGAVLELEDGSRVELAERSEVSLSAHGGDTTVRVARGSIVVEAAPQGRGHLFVATDDCLVAVTGTIFSVSHGSRGSRVSVIEGEVKVAQGRSDAVLAPGEQITTRDGLGTVPVARDVAWSRHRERYAGLLAEIEALDRKIEAAIAADELRYESRLLDLVPADTAIYVALPNVADEIGEVRRIFEEEIARDGALARWWRERGGSEVGERLEEGVARLQALGEPLGEEIVVSVPVGADGEPDAPLILARAAAPARFAAAVGREIERLGREHDGPPLTLVADPSEAPASGDGLFVWLAGDLVAVGAADGLERLDAALEADDGGFAGTPFHRRLAEAYSQGAFLLVGVDLEAVLATAGAERETSEALRFAGLDRVEYLIGERKATAAGTWTGAVVGFAGERTGAARWLADPAPMASLELFSAEAAMASALLLDDPASIADEIAAWAIGHADGEEAAEVDEAIELLARLGPALGGEIAFGIDGPLLPEPAWKVVVEVPDPPAVDALVEEIVARRGAEPSDGPALTLRREEVGGRAYHHLRFGEGPEAVWTVADGYLVAAPSRALVDRALATRASGYGLADSPDFRALAPRDGYVHSSAVAWRNLEAVEGAVEAIGRGSGLPAADELAMLGGELGRPSLTCVYGEPGRIRLVSTSRGGLLGAGLRSVLGMGMLGAGG